MTDKRDFYSTTLYYWPAGTGSAQFSHVSWQVLKINVGGGRY